MPSLKRIRKRRIVVAVVVVTATVLTGLGCSCSRTTRRQMDLVVCQKNLKQIQIALRMYQKEHDGAFPDKLSELYPEYATDLRVFVCWEHSRRHRKEHGVPLELAGSEEIDARGSYRLVPGRRATDEGDTLLAYEKTNHHGDTGRSLLYVDGNGSWNRP